LHKNLMVGKYTNAIKNLRRESPGSIS